MINKSTKMNIKKRIYIIGAGGHGKVVASIARLNGYKEILFVDDKIKFLNNYEVICSTSNIQRLFNEDPKSDYFVAIGNNVIRENFFNIINQNNITQPILIHPSAIIDPTVNIGEGTVIMANVVINADTIIGKSCIINTAATIDHDCICKDFIHISPGVHIAGTVHIGNKTWIGIGSSAINNITICNEVTVGGGATIIADIKESGEYVGTPVRRIR